MREVLVFLSGLLAIVLLSLFGMFLYAIVHAVTRNVMNARKKDFAIYRSIGANQTSLAKLVVNRTSHHGYGWIYIDTYHFKFIKFEYANHSKKHCLIWRFKIISS